jgi:hypothetical protein
MPAQVDENSLMAKTLLDDKLTERLASAAMIVLFWIIPFY